MSVKLLKPKSPSDKQPFASITSTMDGAEIYHKSGFAPVPLAPKTKKPKVKWGHIEATTVLNLENFAGKAGVALKLGSKCGDLVDVDLDSSEARSLAKNFLPPTDSD